MHELMNHQWTYNEGNIAIPHRCEVVFLKASSSHDNAEPFILKARLSTPHTASTCSETISNGVYVILLNTKADLEGVYNVV